jgi:hypothetical protein
MPTFGFADKSVFCILASEHRRGLNDTAKCLEWPYSYESYEATYTLNCLLFEKIAKN